MADSGEYHGIEGVRRLFSILGEKYGFPGALGFHMLLTPVVDIGIDGKTAKGMWHSFGCNTFKGEFGLFAMWQAGKYDLEFVKEDGKWRYRIFRWYVIFRTPYDEGWVKNPIISGLHKKDDHLSAPFTHHMIRLNPGNFYLCPLNQRNKRCLL